MFITFPQQQPTDTTFQLPVPSLPDQDVAMELLSKKDDARVQATKYKTRYKRLKREGKRQHGLKSDTKLD